MEIKYAKFGYEEILSGKKQLLAIEMKILEILKRIISYKSLRNQELNVKNRLKTNAKILKNSLASIYDYVPEENIKIIRSKEKKREKKERRNIQEELDEIKRKLDSL